MDNSTQDEKSVGGAGRHGIAEQRRAFLKMMGGGAVGAVAGIGGIESAQAGPRAGFDPLWTSAQVLIGNSPAEQVPSPVIECPLFFDNGQFAGAFHTLDLSNLPQVRGTISYRGDTIEPDFSTSVAATTTVGSDGNLYLVVAGEAPVAEAKGYFRNITKAIIRCKYKVADPAGTLLIACMNCVVILVRK